MQSRLPWLVPAPQLAGPVENDLSLQVPRSVARSPKAKRTTPCQTACAISACPNFGTSRFILFLLFFFLLLAFLAFGTFQLRLQRQRDFPNHVLIHCCLETETTLVRNKPTMQMEKPLTIKFSTSGKSSASSASFSLCAS